ncbi:MAG TPA: DUF3303 family protein [Tepidiformaceae bacterium]|nr:DUF3303 family protein [Tepidiformaceae bacterium]
MALFVVQHEHTRETCPAQDPQMGQMLLQQLSPQNAATFGVTIHSDAVVDGGHALYAIVEASAQPQVDALFAPFAMAGKVNVMPASSCEVVVERRGC